MKLLVDAGNTRLKWRLEKDGSILDEGWSVLGVVDPLAGIRDYLSSVTRVGVSTVICEQKRLELQSYLESRVSGPVNFYWAEDLRSGLSNSYPDSSTMGADRWHGMYGAWRRCGAGFVVVDAGSAITVDYVNGAGQHLGGYILPGLGMMLRSLKSDAARINFDSDEISGTRPGSSTAECVNRGVSWLTQAMIERIRTDASELRFAKMFVTGGDAARLMSLGLKGEYQPSLVLDGLERIDFEVSGV